MQIGNGLNRISRIPGYHGLNTQRYHKGYNICFPESLHIKLSNFYDTHFKEISSSTYIGYNDTVVVILTKNSVDWTKKLHECLCKEIGAILYQVDKKESWQFQCYNMEVLYIYVPKYHKDKWNKEFSVKLDDVRL